MFGMPNVAPCQSIAVTIWRAVQRTLEWSMKDTPIIDMAVMFEEDACFGGQLELLSVSRHHLTGHSSSSTSCGVPHLHNPRANQNSPPHS